MKSDVISTSEDKITRAAIERSATKWIPRDATLIVVRSGILARTVPICIAGCDLTINQDLKALVPGESVDPRYLFLFLKSREPELLASVTSSATVHRITTTMLESLEIPLPRLEEQKRIVAVLDQAFVALDRARAHAEANRKNAEEVFRTLLETALRADASGWKRLPLKSLGTTQTGTTPKSSEAESYGDFIPFIKPGDFKSDGTLDLENHGLSAFGATKARVVPAGSALMVCIGATIGKSAFTEVEIVTNQQINSIHPHDGISGEFLYYYFITPSFQKEVMSRSGQATLPIINKSKWGEIEVNVPSDLAAQLRIVESLREIRRHTDQLVANYNQKLADLANLRQSLLQKAFSGELT